MLVMFTISYAQILGRDEEKKTFTTGDNVIKITYAIYKQFQQIAFL